MRKKKKVVFVGLYQDSNLGDKIIAHCTEWLFKNRGGIYDCEWLSLDPNIPKTIPTLLYRVWRKLIKLLLGKNRIISTSDRWALYQLEKYYNSEIGAADLVVFVGGGLIKYQYQFCCWGSVSSIIRVAKRKNIPVVLNAVGVEGYNPDNACCQCLKRAIQLPNVKSISVRDDIQTLLNKYLDGNCKVPCEKVADPAVWASEAYGIKQNKESNTIGIGIAWAKIFEPRGYKVSELELEQFYLNVIRILIAQGRQVEIFTNGDLSDNETALHIKNILEGEGVTIPIKLPNDDFDLVDIIAQYQGIIATRLHSAIVAYSLNIPCIGMVWNEKVALWGKSIEREDWFIRDTELTVDNTIRKFDEAVNKGYDQQHRYQFRETIVKSIAQIIERENLK